MSPRLTDEERAETTLRLDLHTVIAAAHVHAAAMDALVLPLAAQESLSRLRDAVEDIPL